MYVYKVHIIGFLLLLSLNIHGQDAQFSQFFATPLYTCPALAGSTGGSRFALNFRRQWPSINGGYTTYTASYDIGIKSIKSGFGFIAFQDMALNSLLSTRYGGLTYSFKFNISENGKIHTGVSYLFTSRSIEYSKLIFKDQLLNNTPASTIENFPSHNKIYHDFNASTLITYNNLFTSLTIDHLFKPNQSLLNKESRIDRKYSSYGGYRMHHRYRSTFGPDEEATHSFVYFYKSQGKFDQLDIGFYSEESNVLVGVLYRGIPLFKKNAQGSINQDALTFLLGFKTDQVYIAYSYDMSLSKLTGKTGGSHEIGLIFIQKNSETYKYQKGRAIFCPEF